MLCSTDTLPSQIQNALVEIKTSPTIYQDFIKDLDSYKSKLSPNEYRYAQVTILALSILEKEVDDFLIHDEVERHEKITQRVYLRAELAFSTGSTSQEIKSSILHRIEAVKNVYLKAKEKENLLGFFKDAFVGPPCFNGRLLSVQEFESTQLNFQDFTWGNNKLLDEEAVQLEELIYHFQELHQTRELPSFDDFVKFLQNQHKKKWGDRLSTDEFPKVFERACLIFVGGEL
ncbi:MAG: hypothetical protein H0U49_00875 [Parachlamydiaceae bacterium]|nr:hypothetical protein [Parachlamydiaceae bacterium]